MVIPVANVECSSLICSLHSLTHQYKYHAYRKKRFPNTLEFHITYNGWVIPQIYRDVRKEYEQSVYEFFHEREEYRTTLKDFMEYILTNYSEEYPEIFI